MAVGEKALTEHIARTYQVHNEHAVRIVSAAGDASRQTGLARTLILAVIAVESSFNCMAVSAAGARGLMQVRPQAHPQKVDKVGGELMLHDVDAGIQVGTRILLEYQRSTGNLAAALARYSGAAHNYAAKVMARKKRFDLIEAGKYPSFALWEGEIEEWAWLALEALGENEPQIEGLISSL